MCPWHPALRRPTRVCATGGSPESSLEHFGEMNAVYAEHFDEPLPARTTIQSDLIGFDVEIDAVIWLGD